MARIKSRRVWVSDRPQPILSVLRYYFISNQDLAKAVGYSQTYVSQANRGKIRPSVDYITRCVKYLQVNPHLLFEMQDDELPDVKADPEPVIGGATEVDPWVTQPPTSLPPPPWTLDELRTWAADREDEPPMLEDLIREAERLYGNGS